MLSGVLRSERAFMVYIQIMRVFTSLCAILMDTLSLRMDTEKIKKKLGNQDKNVKLVFRYLDKLM